MKKILGTYSSPRQHWVGDGFPVRTLFSYDTLGEQMSPSLMLDYAGPTEFTPTTTPRGVGQHPHRGFETVTIVYKGEVSHRDSSGGGGTIGSGDVQLNAGKHVPFTVNEGHTVAVVVLKGTVQVNNSQISREAQMVVLDQVGTEFTIEANTDAKFLILSGLPLNEPIAGYGPFVMNTTQEIDEAIRDFNNGRFGTIAS